MMLLRALAIAAVFEQASAQSGLDDPAFLASLACGCDDNCCDIQPIDTKTSSSFQFEFAPTEVQGATYSLVVGDHLADVELTNIDLSFVSPEIETVDCINSFAVMSSADGTVSRTVNMVNNGPKDCLVSWDGLFETPGDFAGKDIYVFYLFAGLTGDDSALNAKVFIFPSSDPIVTLDQLTQPNFLVTFFQGQSGAESGQFQTVVNLTRNTFTEDSCAMPETVTLTYGGCGERVVLGVPFDSQTFTYIDTLTRAEADACASSVTETEGTIVYQMEPTLSVELPPSCDPSKPTFPETESSVQYSIVADAEATDDDSQTVNQLVVLLSDYTTVPCNGRIVPMAQLQVTVEVSSSIVPDSRDLDGLAVIDEVALVRDPSASSCTDNTGTGGDFVCLETYVTEECLLMDLVEEDDSVTCTFERLGFLNIEVGYTYPGFSETTGLKSPLLEPKTFSGDECPVLAIQEDVSTDFPVTVTVDGANLNSLVTTTVSFDNVDNAASVTLKILNVLVSIGDGEYTHTYDILDKLALLSRPQTPYYSDAHFCRFEATEGQCVPFYDSESTDRWNAFYEANSAQFSVPGAGFEGCQDVDARAEDRFAFVPNNWVFNEFEGTVTDMTITVVAEVDTCSTSGGVSTRLLQDSEPEVIQVTSGTVRVSVDSEPKDGEAVVDAEAPGTRVGGIEGVPAWIIALVAVASCGILLVLVLVTLCLKRKVPAPKPSETMSAAPAPGNSLQLV